MNEGYIKLFRSLKEWGWSDNPNMVATWIHLLLSANWKDDQEWHGEPLGRGELITSLPKLSTSIGLTEKQIRTCLDRLEKSGEIKKSRADKWTRITICKYGDYQAPEDEAGQDKGRIRAERGQDEGRQRAADEEVKKERSKEEKEKDIQKKKVEAAERLYNLYPASAIRSEGNRVSLRSAKDKNKIVKLLDTFTEEQLEYTIKRYLSEKPGAYIKMLSTFLNNLPDYGSFEDGRPFEEKPWRKDGVLYNKADFVAHMTNAEYADIPPSVKGAIMSGGSVLWDGTKFIVPNNG